MNTMHKKASIDEWYTYDEFDDGCICTNALKNIRYGIQIHPYISARDAKQKKWERIKKAQNGWKVAELS